MVSIQPAQIRRQTNPCRTSESAAACGTSAMTRSRVAFVSLHSAQRGVSSVRTSAIRGINPLARSVLGMRCDQELRREQPPRCGAGTKASTGGRIAPTVAARWPATLHPFSVAVFVRPAARSQPNRQQSRSQLGALAAARHGGRIRAVRAGPGVSSFASAPQTTPPARLTVTVGG